LALGTGLETAVEIRSCADQTTSEIDNKNQLEEHFISSQAFYRTPGGHVREIIVGEQFEPQILKLFNPVAQESNWASPATNPTQLANPKPKISGTNQAAPKNCWTENLTAPKTKSRNKLHRWQAGC
jgi:hypothetical protein